MELERLTEQQFRRFRDFIYRNCGIRVDEKKRTLLSNRIRKRLKAGGFPDFDAYYAFVTSPAGTAELGGFLDAVTTNETYFFRTGKHFDWFKEEFVSEIVAAHRRGDRPASLRVWSAGCASGAEPYSIAVCLAENAFRLRGWKLEVLGTDLSEESLAAARLGAYPLRLLKDLSEQQLRRFFRRAPEAETWSVQPELKRLVAFQHHNLMQPPPQPPFDCIWIRNVLIYFDRDSKQQVVKRLIQALVPGGYLVVGPSEGVYDLLDDLDKVSTFLYRKANHATPAAAPPPTRRLP